MVKDERKRQKALAKRKKRESQVRKEANKARNPAPQDLVRAMQRGSWYVCYETGADQGLHNIICVRNSPLGPIGCSFLLDRYCLGVKAVDVMKSIDLARLSEFVQEREGRTVSPAYALKLITFVAEEGRKIGFEPPRHFAALLPIFFDVDVSECTEEFEFGKNGKPLYISGPFDSLFEQQEILSKLQRLGAGKFDIMMSVSSEQIADRFGADDLFDDEEEYEDDGELGNTIDSTATVVSIATEESATDKTTKF